MDSFSVINVSILPISSYIWLIFKLRLFFSLLKSTIFRCCSWFPGVFALVTVFEVGTVVVVAVVAAAVVFIAGFDVAVVDAGFAGATGVVAADGVICPAGFVDFCLSFS